MQKRNRSLERGLALLAHLVERGPATLATLTRAAHLPKATASRLMLTLAEAGWAYRRHNDGRFIATLPAAEATDLPDRGRAARLALPHLIALSQATGLAADLTWAVAEGVLEVIESTRHAQPGGVDPQVAGFRPSLVFSAPGRAYLAAIDRAALSRHLHQIERTDSPAERLAVKGGQLAKELAATEKRGFAQRAAGYWPQSSDYGSEPMDIAVPILVQRRPVGCLSLVWPAERHAAHDIATAHLVAMRATALAIERAVRA